MSEINPYASPRFDEPPEPFTVEGLGGPQVGVWRDDSAFVMHKQARLPDRCVKCNAAVADSNAFRLRRKLTWHHPLIYAALIPAIVPYLLLTAIFGHTAVIHVGICRGCRGKRWIGIVVVWMMVIASTTMCLSGFDSVERTWLVVLAFFLICGSAALWIATAEVVTPKRMDKFYIWIDRVHPDYLNALPPWDEAGSFNHSKRRA